MTIATIPPPITQVIPKVGRDFKDDYLLAYASVEEVDYLVSGDEDLQVLKEVNGVRIVSPAEFLKILRNQ